MAGTVVVDSSYNTGMPSRTATALAAACDRPGLREARPLAAWLASADSESSPRPVGLEVRPTRLQSSYIVYYNRL